MKQIQLTKTQITDLQNILDPFVKRSKLGIVHAYNNFKDNQKATHKFLSIINISVCPYCNINYVYTTECKVNGSIKYVGRPDFDHFEPKSKRKHLAMTSTNLIPSCQICNEKIKRDMLFSRTTHMHPYFDDFDSIVLFAIDLKQAGYTREENFQIFFKYKNNNSLDNNKAKNNIKDLLLEERYQYHKREVINLFKRMSRYSNQKKLNSINELVYGKSNIIKDFFPEKYCEINQISLGKLKKDIVNQYLKLE